MGYFDYTKEKDFLICIDSDGCAGHYEFKTF